MYKIFFFLKKHHIFLIILASYTAFNLLTLTKYPRVHDDEGFLATWAFLLHQHGIPIIDPNLSDHGAFKGMLYFPFSGSIFFGSLALIGKYFGFGLFAMRMQPLLFSVISVILTYGIAGILFAHNNKKMICSALFMATSNILLMSSHVVRPEAMLVANLLLIYYLLLTSLLSKYRGLLICCASFLSGISVSIHPNGIFFPVIMLMLFYFMSKKSEKQGGHIYVRSLFFIAIGLLVSSWFDYFPYKSHYWRLFNSQFMAGYTYNNSLASIFIKPLYFIANLWSFFWHNSHHQNVIYLIVALVAMVGGFFIRTRAHSLLLVTASSLLFLLFILHFNNFYMVYLVPFLSMLFASVLFEVSTKINSLFKKKIARLSYYMFSGLFVVTYVMCPIITIWCFRGYDYYKTVSQVCKYVGDGERVLSSFEYFFELYSCGKNEQLFSSYLLYNYDVKALIAELNVKHVIVDRDFVLRLHDNTLPSLCSIEGTFKNYKPNFIQPDLNGDVVGIYKCQGAFGN